jgi:hypothetical protein
MQMVPINKVNVAPGTALPAINTDILSSAIAPSLDPGLLRIYVCMSIAGVLSVGRYYNAVETLELLNSGNALIAGAAYMFSVAWKMGETINFQYSTTTGTISKLQVDETWG